MMKFDGPVRSPKSPFSVIPAKAGIQEKQALLDPGFRRGDGIDECLRDHQVYWLRLSPSAFFIRCSTCPLRLRVDFRYVAHAYGYCNCRYTAKHFAWRAGILQFALVLLAAAKKSPS